MGNHIFNETSIAMQFGFMWVKIQISLSWISSFFNFGLLRVVIKKGLIFYKNVL